MHRVYLKAIVLKLNLYCVKSHLVVRFVYFLWGLTIVFLTSSSFAVVISRRLF